MRDPSIVEGPDGTFHMVWTTSWRGKTIGYSSSKDLIHWTAQKAFTVGGDDTINCWAPDVFYDHKAREFVVVFASTIKGKFPETLGKGNNDYNHRLYAIRTKDFSTISETELFYDPGFQVIDGVVNWDFRGNRWVMIAKNETLNPPAKHLFTVFANSLRGPWTAPSERISGPEWAEGPTLIRRAEGWYLYLDRYRKKQYSVLRSKDLKTWEDISDQLQFPEGARHGTAFWAPSKIVEKLN
jgi:beta-xylosidase